MPEVGEPWTRVISIDSGGTQFVTADPGHTIKVTYGNAIGDTQSQRGGNAQVDCRVVDSENTNPDLNQVEIRSSTELLIGTDAPYSIPVAYIHDDVGIFLVNRSDVQTRVTLQGLRIK